MPSTDAALRYYTKPAVMTAAGPYQPLLADLPRGVAALAGVAQGLIIHEHLAGLYGVTLSDERRATVHIRPVAELLARILAEDGRPLTAARAPAARTAGNCRHFTVLTVAMLRAQGVPARARCGFGDYFGSGWFEDHWVCEYWDEAAERWVLADAQLDDRLRQAPDIDFDPLDVPRGRFLVAGEAWRRCRRGDADPGRFGLSLLHQAGDWWIAGNLLRDVAALNNMEMLPWDVWGAMPGPGEPIGAARLALFDRLADLTADPGAADPGAAGPDAAPADLAAAYTGDDRLRVPATVYNAIRNRAEPVLPAGEPAGQAGR